MLVFAVSSSTLLNVGVFGHSHGIRAGCSPPPSPPVLKIFGQNAYDEKYGDRGPPCLTPRVRLKKSDDGQLFITQL